MRGRPRVIESGIMYAAELLDQKARMTIPDLRSDMEGLFTQWVPAHICSG
jgi:hypothetical protein